MSDVAMYPTIIPAMSSIVLLRTIVDRNKIIARITNAPINAPDTVAVMPIISPAAENEHPVVRATIATPRLEPEVMPKIEGPASGLASVVCSIRPAAESAAPQNRAVTHCGTRDCITITCHVGLPPSPPVSISKIAASGIRTEPNTILSTARTTSSADRMIYIWLVFNGSRESVDYLLYGVRKCEPRSSSSILLSNCPLSQSWSISSSICLA